MHVSLAYGRSHLSVDLPDDQTTVIVPAPNPGLSDEKLSLTSALNAPLGTSSLATQITPETRITIVHTDITRPTPNDRIIPWLLEYLRSAGASPDRITLLNALGTHRPNTRQELEEMLTPAVVAQYRCVNHGPENPAAHRQFGFTRSGAPVLINKHLADADVRIITGFIEPHFFAGFSGGPKGIMPGVAALSTVQSNHGHDQIRSPNATFGMTEGNPVWEEMLDIALRVGPSFLLNVTLNEERQITGYFAGDLRMAHRAGTEFVRASAMQPVDDLFDIVLTTNSGYPLDMNLYQAVKGMRAAERIVRPGGLILLAAECSEGLPAGSPHDQLLRSFPNGEALLAQLADPEFAFPEQWQSQIQALIQQKAEIHVFSALEESVIRAAHLIPCRDIEATIASRLTPTTRIAVLPQGPLTVPYLRK
jgi:nickel-dependent lactate racemase